MDNRPPKQPRYMDIVGGPRSPRPATARPIRQIPPRPTAQPAPKRPPLIMHTSKSYTDPIAARPVARHTATPRPAAPAPRPKIVQSTTVKTVAATEDRVESFEFGIIEDLSPVVKPEPPMIPGSRPADPAPAAKPAAASAKVSKVKKPEIKPSPFLSHVDVPKRPLSASAPTGIYAPAPKPVSTPAAKPKKKRKNAPFIVIVILSVLLGVSLGALVYFVLPH